MSPPICSHKRSPTLNSKKRTSLGSVVHFICMFKDMMIQQSSSNVFISEVFGATVLHQKSSTLQMALMTRVMKSSLTTAILVVYYFLQNVPAFGSLEDKVDAARVAVRRRWKVMWQATNKPLLRGERRSLLRGAMLISLCWHRTSADRPDPSCGGKSNRKLASYWSHPSTFLRDMIDYIWWFTKLLNIGCDVALEATNNNRYIL